MGLGVRAGGTKRRRLDTGDGDVVRNDQGLIACSTARIVGKTNSTSVDRGAIMHEIHCSDRADQGY